MPSLSQQISDRITSASRRRVELPGYWAILQTALMVVVSVSLFVMLVRPESAPNSAQSPFGGPIDVPSPTSSSSGPASIEPTEPADATTVSDITGKSAQVSSAALGVARSSALAAFTGRWKDVPVQAGLRLPPAIGATSPSVTAQVLIGSSSDSLQFAIGVDPDDSGPAAARSMTVTVARVSGSWVLTGLR